MEQDRGFFSWNLPAAIAALIAGIWGLSGGKPQSDPTVDSQVAREESSHNTLPTHDGLASFSMRAWQEPFLFRREAQRLFETGQIDSTCCRISQEEKDAGKPAHYLQIFEEILEDEKNQLLIMPISVLGEERTADRNDRARYRHAVENALAANGYFLEFSDRMSYAYAEDLSVYRAGLPIRINTAVPIKLYKRAAPAATDSKTRRETSMLLSYG